MKQEKQIGLIIGSYLEPSLEKLKIIFNDNMLKLYYDLGFLLNDKIRDQIYPIVYGYMRCLFERAIKNDTKPHIYSKGFQVHASRAVKMAMKMNNIDPISNECALSTLCNNALQEEIVLDLAPEIITSNSNIENNTSRVKDICSINFINIAEYTIEKNIIYNNISKLYKENYSMYVTGEDKKKKRLKR